LKVGDYSTEFVGRRLLYIIKGVVLGDNIPLSLVFSSVLPVVFVRKKFRALLRKVEAAFLSIYLTPYPSPVHGLIEVTLGLSED